jgi:hypothetical protein
LLDETERRLDVDRDFLSLCFVLELLGQH